MSGGVMPDWLPAKLADTWIPEIIDRIRAQWVLHAVFWPCFALTAVPITLRNWQVGTPFVLAVVLIVVWTARAGLAGVHTVVWWPGAAFMLFVALILGGFQARLDQGFNLTGGRLVVFLVFLVCVASFSGLLAAIDRDRRRRLLSEDAPDTGELPAQPKAELRLTVMKLWVATMAMIALQAYTAATVCMIALWMRGRVTAILAGISSMLLVLVTFQGGEILIETDPLEIAVGLLAGYQWFRAAFRPWWRRGTFQ
ncbi:hypothetical protein JOF56_006747 [Kibdelosporangium banguiense]|uniref:Transmembrane protein n=1 Tax=Kibdelosporangium banguiense TaxID=1365924 RepID=A0ABS4TPN9_9PSEU|nr:hypothetical protein [Kibdelosporangium banguiense]MBP2326362.1 hypothetical protein [Kibdelosporangium banguiense]